MRRVALPICVAVAAATVVCGTSPTTTRVRSNLASLSSLDLAFTTVDVPGALATACRGIDDSGRIVGRYEDAQGVHGFQLDASFSRFDFQTATYTEINGITPSLDFFVGGYATDDGSGCRNPGTPGCHGFVLLDEENGLDVPNSVSTIPYAATLSGLRIVGMYADVSGGVHGFRYTLSGGFVTIDPPDAVLTFANGINIPGDIVGRWDDADGTHGYLLRAGAFEKIDVPGASSTIAEGISADGTIVGEFTDEDGATHGFLLADDYSTLDFPGATSTIVRAMNVQGEIVGSYILDGAEHGFLGSLATRPSARGGTSRRATH